MAKKKNSKRTMIAMVSVDTGYRKVTMTNKQNRQLKNGGASQKLRLRMYDPLKRAHTWFEETKANLGRNEIKPRKS